MRSPDPFVLSSVSITPSFPPGDEPSTSILRREASESRGRHRSPSAREIVDTFVDRVRAGERASESDFGCTLRDLATSVRDLGGRPRGKVIVRGYDEPWELCVERIGERAALSVYRAGPDPLVLAYDVVVRFEAVASATRAAIERHEGTHDGVELDGARAALADYAPIRFEDDGPTTVSVVVDMDRDAPLAIGAEFPMRDGARDSGDAGVERTDLHALLFRGKIRAEIRGRLVELPDAYPFLVAERLLEISRHVLDAWERGLAYHVRREAGGIVVGVRSAATGRLALTLGSPASAPGDRVPSTFPALDVSDVVEASLAFGRALVRAILRRDRSQGGNLRVVAFRRALRETGDALREMFREDAKINPSPEPFRAFAEQARDAVSKSSPPAPGALNGSRLRYASRWRALVPGIDLRATFLCGERLVVGAAQETFCLARASGEVLWRTRTQRATSVVTPAGIARIAPDGAIAVHDFGNGEITLRARVAPRLGGPPAGAVVNIPGLPRLLVVTEGDQHLVAIDLASGEARWRFPWRTTERGATLRLKRAGRLLYVTTGDSALTAIDVTDGATIWRVRDRLRFRAPPTVDHDQLFALAGGTSSLAQLHGIDSFSGSVHWTRALPDPPTACSVEGAPLLATSVVALALRSRNGVALSAFDRQTGALRWTTEAPVAPTGTSWLAIDDLFVGNTPTGEIVGIHATSGDLAYRHVLGTRSLESDVPRRLEPVLRSGALFVPHAEVHVIRPRDGTPLGTIGPCEAIPDLLRVDERGDVYIAEESGHLVSFGALPRLSLVR
jgi:outer membrane protein assembly factor BamB